MDYDPYDILGTGIWQEAQKEAVKRYGHNDQESHFKLARMIKDEKKRKEERKKKLKPKKKKKTKKMKDDNGSKYIPVDRVRTQYQRLGRPFLLSKEEEGDIEEIPEYKERPIEYEEIPEYEGKKPRYKIPEYKGRPIEYEEIPEYKGRKTKIPTYKGRPEYIDIDVPDDENVYQVARTRPLLLPSGPRPQEEFRRSFKRKPPLPKGPRPKLPPKKSSIKIPEAPPLDIPIAPQLEILGEEEITPRQLNSMHKKVEYCELNKMLDSCQKGDISYRHPSVVGVPAYSRSLENVPGVERKQDIDKPPATKVSAPGLPPEVAAELSAALENPQEALRRARERYTKKSGSGFIDYYLDNY